jgi:hypothetical protein
LLFFRKKIIFLTIIINAVGGICLVKKYENDDKNNNQGNAGHTYHKSTHEQKAQEQRNTSDQREPREPREARNSHEQGSYRNNNQYRNQYRENGSRHNYANQFSSASKVNYRAKPDETADDIKIDIARIEKEIQLEIKEIKSMRLGL